MPCLKAAVVEVPRKPPSCNNNPLPSRLNPSCGRCVGAERAPEAPVHLSGGVGSHGVVCIVVDTRSILTVSLHQINQFSRELVSCVSACHLLFLLLQLDFMERQMIWCHTMFNYKHPSPPPTHPLLLSGTLAQGFCQCIASPAVCVTVNMMQAAAL